MVYSFDFIYILFSWHMFGEDMLTSYGTCVADIQEGGSKEQLWITVKSFIP